MGKAMGFEIKICGVTTPEAVDASVVAGATMLGFVFFPRSPRFVSLEHASALAAPVRGRTTLVALVVDPDDDLLRAVTAGFAPDLIQLHGKETLERTAAIRAGFGSVMKAVAIGAAEDVAIARAYGRVADRVLVDAKPPATPQALPGGNGLSFDWRLFENLDPPFEFMLSGGLDAETVARAIEWTRPAGVDVSSGVEQAPGLKDPARIAAFVAAARAAASVRQPALTP